MCFYSIFYKEEDDPKWVMDVNTILRGQVCCSLYFEDQKWHRAKIIGDLETESVKVCFVDFGTIGKVSIENLRYLTFFLIRKDNQLYF